MKQLSNTKATVRLRKMEDRKEWYVYIESYPVFVPGKKTPQRVREYLNRCVTTVEWDKKRIARSMADGTKTYKPKRDDNGIIICRSEKDQETQNLMLPWIGKGLAKISYFQNKIEQRQVPIIEETILAEEVGATEETMEPKVVEEDKNGVIDELPGVPEQPSLEDIRQEQLQIRIKEQEEKLNIALNYTRKSFVLYLSDKDLDMLCHNVQIYINKLDTAGLNPVKVKELTAVDLRHFGWNIWNYFRPREQIEIASFLKTVFPDVFRETEIKSIKRYLKDDELKGVIKIEENIMYT